MCHSVNAMLCARGDGRHASCSSVRSATTFMTRSRVCRPRTRSRSRNADRVATRADEVALQRDEVRLAGELDEPGRKLRLLLEETRGGAHVAHEVTWLARAERDVALARVLRDPLRGLRVEREPVLLADAAHDLRELRVRRRLHLDLVLDASKERLVDERRRRAVRREDEEHIEGHLDLATVVQREEVDVAVEGDDPAVQEILRRDA